VLRLLRCRGGARRAPVQRAGAAAAANTPARRHPGGGAAARAPRARPAGARRAPRCPSRSPPRAPSSRCRRPCPPAPGATAHGPGARPRGRAPTCGARLPTGATHALPANSLVAKGEEHGCARRAGRAGVRVFARQTRRGGLGLEGRVGVGRGRVARAVGSAGRRRGGVRGWRGPSWGAKEPPAAGPLRTPRRATTSPRARPRPGHSVEASRRRNKARRQPASPARADRRG
jgi:hypothetical protein